MILQSSHTGYPGEIWGHDVSSGLIVLMHMTPIPRTILKFIIRNNSSGTHCGRAFRCHRTSPISQHWFRLWIDAVRQQAITWANIDPIIWFHMATWVRYEWQNYSLTIVPLCQHFLQEFRGWCHKSPDVLGRWWSPRVGHVEDSSPLPGRLQTDWNAHCGQRHTPGKQQENRALGRSIFLYHYNTPVKPAIGCRTSRGLGLTCNSELP